MERPPVSLTSLSAANNLLSQLKFIFCNNLLFTFFLCCSFFIKSFSSTDINVYRRRHLLDNGLGSTPPMGWNSWNHFNCKIDEIIVRQTADALVSTGLAKLGYEYVNLDDCWAESARDSEGNLVANKSTFPSGIKALADYVHSKGLKLGIYADSGRRTCTGTMPGSLNHEEQDARTFASWGIDYLKYDNCFNDDIKPTIRYPIMSRALNKTGRPIFFSICEWGDMHPALWAGDWGNSWRTTNDISNSWIRSDEHGTGVSYCVGGNLGNDCIRFILDLWKIGDSLLFATWHMPYLLDDQSDPDMLEVGNRGMKFSEYVVHFSIWAISKAPLLLGCDIRNTTTETMVIIGNKEVIDVNQDLLGKQAKKVRMQGQRTIWAGPLSGNKVVVLFVNQSPRPTSMTAHWDDIGIPNNTVVEARDLWKHQTLETNFSDKLTTSSITPHSCMMFILKPIP
ncbi:hypothetical protein MKX03_018865 [Papaver bracteatum]|nr:hypothetical protein MKX03_018865 [Papaver bracteatum]